YIIVRPFFPFTYNTVVELLGGTPWEGVTHGHSILSLGQSGHLEPRADELHLNAETNPHGRVVESLYLKLRLFTDAVTAVRTMVRHTRRPILSLSDDSFRVEFVANGSSLPQLWTNRVILVNPGDTVATPIGKSGMVYYQLTAPPMLSSYRAETV